MTNESRITKVVFRVDSDQWIKVGILHSERGGITIEAQSLSDSPPNTISLSPQELKQVLGILKMFWPEIFNTTTSDTTPATTAQSTPLPRVE